MNEMIERVARALHAQTFPEVCRGDEAWLQAAWESSEFDRARHLAAARAAIEAMREPTDAMCAETRSEWVSGHEAGGIWRAMIDAALAPTPPETPGR